MRTLACLGFSAALTLTCVGVVPLFGVGTAHAQSAADKATARQLATEGIDLYRAGKHAEALDKLQRAQKLYDAPPHLLYIARSQVGLGKVVEGAETYRTLIRADIPAGSPPAFKQAVEDAKKDLTALEPKIPAVRITVKPESASGLDIRIDDEKVPAEIVGVDRAINPGQHTIKISAPGFQPAQQTVDVKLGEKKPVALELLPAGGAAPVVAPAPGEGPAPVPGPQPPPGPGPGPGPEPAPPPTTNQPGNIGFMIGARVGLALPFGDAFHGTTANPDETAKMSDFYGPGGGFELHGGFRFARLYTVKLMVGGYGFAPGDKAEVDSAIEADNTTSATSVGLGMQIGTPRGQFGGFGEIDFLLVHNFTITNKLGSPADCEVSVTSKGPGLLVGGGLSIPLSPSWSLTPVLNAQLGRFEEQEFDEDCGFGLPSSGDIPDGDQRTHGMLFFGIGGEFLFGPDKPTN